VLAALLCESDARRATEVVDALLAHGLQCALTGGLAIEAQLRAHGRPVVSRQLNDIDFVVEGFAAIPESLAGSFLQHHVHPDASEGKTLLQLIDRRRALRIDLFGAFGGTLSRACRLDDQTGALSVLSIEDLVARSTSFVCGRLQRGRTLDPKHVSSFRRLRGLGHPQRLRVISRQAALPDKRHFPTSVISRQEVPPDKSLLPSGAVETSRQKP
jgi:hypothetical protein